MNTAESKASRLNPLRLVKYYVESMKLMTPLLWAIMGSMILANIAAQMVFPLESLYLEDLGASIAQIGLFFTMAAVAPLFFQIFGGWMSDSIGRLKAIAIGSIAGTFGSLAYFIAPSWQFVLIGSIFTQLAIAFVAPSIQAYIAEVSSEETRGRLYGVTSMLFMVVMIIGPLLGAAIAQGRTFKAMLFVAMLFYASAAVVRITIAYFAGRKAKAAGEIEREKPTFDGFRTSVRNVFGLLTAGGIITWIFLSDGIRDVSFNMSFRLMPLYLEQIVNLSILQIGSLNSLAAVVAMMVMAPAGWISDKLGERVGIAGGFSLFALGWVLFVSGGTFTAQIVARLFIGAGWGLVDPSYNSLISKVVPEKLRGIAFGLFATSLGLVSLPSPWIGAQLWDRISPQAPFIVPAIAMLITIPIIWFKFRLPKEGDTPSDEGTPITPDVVVAASGGD